MDIKHYFMLGSINRIHRHKQKEVHASITWHISEILVICCKRMIRIWVLLDPEMLGSWEICNLYHYLKTAPFKNRHNNLVWFLGCYAASSFTDDFWLCNIYQLQVLLELNSTHFSAFPVLLKVPLHCLNIPWKPEGADISLKEKDVFVTLTWRSFLIWSSTQNWKFKTGSNVNGP